MARMVVDHNPRKLRSEHRQKGDLGDVDAQGEEEGAGSKHGMA